jgi:hypothetical protein
MMCARKSTYGLIVDFNPKNAEFIQKTIELVKACGSRDAFKDAMIRYLNSLKGNERDLFFHKDQPGQPTDNIELELQREGSWLQSEESYLYIKAQLVSKNRLIAITEDIKNFDHFSKMRKFLDKHHIVIDTLYTSNICQFMNGPDEKSAFAKSIKQLLNDDTIFINCPRFKQPNAPKLGQRPLIGSEVLKNSFDDQQLFEVEEVN